MQIKGSVYQHACCWLQSNHRSVWPADKVVSWFSSTWYNSQIRDQCICIFSPLLYKIGSSFTIHIEIIIHFYISRYFKTFLDTEVKYETTRMFFHLFFSLNREQFNMFKGRGYCPIYELLTNTHILMQTVISSS